MSTDWVRARKKLRPYPKLGLRFFELSPIGDKILKFSMTKSKSGLKMFELSPIGDKNLKFSMTKSNLGP